MNLFLSLYFLGFEKYTFSHYCYINLLKGQCLKGVIVKVADFWNMNFVKAAIILY